MTRKYKGRRNRTRRKRNLLLRRITVTGIFILVVSLLGFVGWQVARGIATAFATGDQPIPASRTTTTTAIPTTTTTYPTISVGAQLTTPRVLVYDITHSAMLYSQNAEQQCYPASLTKLLTAIIVSEECEEDEVFTVGSELSFVQPDASRAGLKAGYKLTRDMIIAAMLLPSGNDAAYSIAVHVGRKLSDEDDPGIMDALFAFTDRMNEKAIEIGAKNSHFSNPDGYFSPDHYTTAYDMLQIAKAVLQYDNLRETMGKSSVDYILLSGEKMTFKNSNKLMSPSNPYYFEGATGMKTGFTNEAGHCIATSAKRNGVEIITIVMGGISNESRYADAITLMNAAFSPKTTSTITQ
ncbi:MAG: D-alanyl-D-alanine carboxypeptidase [Oscillospiraceae bacterium]|nr:D-alanyl-D-alanine carboxypeptidase [Oscillospiraceae bacterium]MDD4413319.1 D-alanyl-D-alanine carboxypeptidase [Oscillospiraceae bacterium]